MFQTKIRINFIGIKKEIMGTVSAIDVPENYAIEYVLTDSLDEAVIPTVDYIVADMPFEEYAQLLDFYSKNRKGKHTKLVLSASREEVTPLLSLVPLSTDPFEPSVISDIWPRDLSIKEFFYYYNKWCAICGMYSVVRQQRGILDTIFKSTKDLMWIKDIEGYHLEMSDSFLRVLPPSRIDGHKKTRKECVNKDHLFLWELSPEEYDAGDFVCMESEDSVIKNRKSMLFNENLLTSDGMRKLITTKAPLFDVEGNVIATLGIARDITNETKYREKLQKSANTDMLTELENRRSIYKYLKDNKSSAMILLYMDLDGFKGVNDKFGHKKGDEALVLTANTLKEKLYDFRISRMGGDEFLAVKCFKTDEEVVDNGEDEKIKKDLLEAFKTDPAFENLSISVGKVIKSCSNTAVDKIIAEADEKMYSEKKLKKMR